MSQTRQTTVYFTRLKNGDYASLGSIDAVMPVKGFVPEEGKPYFVSIVRQPPATYEYGGKMYVPCMATLVEEKKGAVSLLNAFEGVDLSNLKLK